MPIYEYYCLACDGCFSHLARQYDAPPPPCPGCGSHDVEKLISRVSLGRSDAERRADFDARAQGVNQEDSREMAKFLQNAGSLADESTPFDQDVFQEIIARRAEGAKDEDLQDVTDAIPFPRQTFIHPHDHGHEEAQTLTHTHDHGHCCDGSCSHSSSQKSSPRRAKDLGWG